MQAVKETRPAVMLAGKSAERAVMRNGNDGSRRRQAQGTVQITGTQGLDECSTEGQRALQQRLQALSNANDIRLERADIRRRLTKGSLDFDEFLDEMPECCLKVHVVKALTWLPGIGADRAEALMSHLKDAKSMEIRLGQLSQRDKYTLSALVTQRRYRRLAPLPAAA